MPLIYLSFSGTLMRYWYSCAFPFLGHMNALALPGCNVRLPVTWSMAAQYSPSGGMRGASLLGFGGWGVDFFHIVFHEVLSMETSCTCVIPVLCWYLVSFCYLFMCYGGNWFDAIWDDVWHTLGWPSWCASWLKCYAPIWVHPQRWRRWRVWRCLWGIHPWRWCHL